MEIPGGLYRAEHRALRELHAGARHLAGHWERLAGRVGGQPAVELRRGAGARLAGLRNAAGDLLLERNQALRAAVLDVVHLVTLLRYAENLAATRGDDALATFHASWAERLAAVEDAARTSAADLGRDPSGAIVPAEPSALGRLGQRVGAAVGGAGESIDSSAVGRVARRFSRG